MGLVEEWWGKWGDGEGTPEPEAGKKPSSQLLFPSALQLQPAWLWRRFLLLQLRQSHTGEGPWGGRCCPVTWLVPLATQGALAPFFRVSSGLAA